MSISSKLYKHTLLFRFKRFLTAMLLILITGMAAIYANKPVTVIVNLSPPYTPFLNEYGAAGTSKLQVTLLVNDARMVNHPAKLQMVLEHVGSGIVMQTAEYASIPPIMLTGNVTEVYNGIDLAQYFRATNNVFSSLDQSQYLGTGRIPDGQYRIGFRVVDANRTNILLSNTTYTQPGWFILNEPPFLNLPRNKEEQRVADPQHVKLEWFPRHLGSMNSAFSTSYQIELFAIRVPGMDPTQLAQSLKPDFIAVTNRTNYSLTPDKFILEPGVEYAWRVKAMAGQNELTLFQNGGYSEVFSFIYGTLCPVPENGSINTVGAENATFSWDSDPLHTSYELRVRKSGAENSNWYTKESYLNESAIAGILSPGTAYEYQVKAKCNNVESDYNLLQTFRTEQAQSEKFECGAKDNKTVSNNNPKDYLHVGEIIYYGKFPIKLTEIEGSHGFFKGKGRMRIPFLGNIQVNMQFKDIRVNELNEVYEGEIVSIYNPDSKFYIDDITDYWTVGDQVGNVITGQEAAQIKIDYVLDPTTTTVVLNDNKVIVNGTGGVTSTTIATSTGGTTIVDKNGNLYSVDSTGKIEEVGISGTDTENYNSNLNTYNSLNTDNVVVFTNAEDATWAFDSWNAQYKDISLITKEYEDIKGYKVPWKLIPTGKSGKVFATLAKGDVDIKKVFFKTPTGTEYKAKYGDGGAELTIIGSEHGDGQEIYALYPINDSTTISLGKLKIASYNMVVRELNIVPINEIRIDREQISKGVNDIFVKYGVEWRVKAKHPFVNSSWDINGDKKMDAGESGTFSMYTNEMLALNKIYTQDRGVENEAMYLFVLKESTEEPNTLLGDMPISSQFGYIFSPGVEEITAKTVAHELGHGMFQLKHTFDDEYKVPMSSTNNLMDYSVGTQLFKQQWDAMFDPKSLVFAWLQGDDKGNAVAKFKYSCLFNKATMKTVLLSEKGIRDYCIDTGLVYTGHSLVASVSKDIEINYNLSLKRVGVDCKMRGLSAGWYKVETTINDNLVNELPIEKFSFQNYKTNYTKRSNSMQLILKHKKNNSFYIIDTLKFNFVYKEPEYFLKVDGKKMGKAIGLDNSNEYKTLADSSSTFLLIDNNPDSIIRKVNWFIEKAGGDTTSLNSDTLKLKIKAGRRIKVRAFFKHKGQIDTINFEAYSPETLPKIVSPLAYNLEKNSINDTMVYEYNNSKHVAVRSNGGIINFKFIRKGRRNDFNNYHPVAANPEKLDVNLLSQDEKEIAIQVTSKTQFNPVDSTYINLIDADSNIRASQIVYILKPLSFKIYSNFDRGMAIVDYIPQGQEVLNYIGGNIKNGGNSMLSFNADIDKNNQLDRFYGDPVRDEYESVIRFDDGKKLKIVYVPTGISYTWRIDSLFANKQEATLVRHRGLDSSFTCNILDSSLKVINSGVQVTCKDTTVTFSRNVNSNAKYIRHIEMSAGLKTSNTMIIVGVQVGNTTHEVLVHEILHTKGLVDIKNPGNLMHWQNVPLTISPPCLNNETVKEVETGTGFSKSDGIIQKQWLNVQR